MLVHGNTGGIDLELTYFYDNGVAQSRDPVCVCMLCTENIVP